ncbi:WbqC family protein [Plasticicumulans lactativorans]|nr:WbqC family protein [Plasticicumulans lactativorans]
MRVAVMQPYFFPYLNYFRLFAAADLFVLYDCVQFPRGGWVHRNRLHGADGRLRWLTLPLKRGPLARRIRELAFDPAREAAFVADWRRFPRLAEGLARQPAWRAHLLPAGRTPVGYLADNLRAVCAVLGLACPIVASSAFGLPAGLCGRARLFALLGAAGAREYVNLPGGVALYAPREFAAAGVRLRFVPHYRGDAASMLERVLGEPAARLRAELDDFRLLDADEAAAAAGAAA